MLVKVSPIRHACTVNRMASANTTLYAETNNVFYTVFVSSTNNPISTVKPTCSRNFVTAFAAVFALLHAIFLTGYSVYILFFSTFF